MTVIISAGRRTRYLAHEQGERSMRTVTLAITLFMSATAAIPVLAQHANHMAHDQTTEGIDASLRSGPQEPGNGAFAAISEIVALLATDPTTDWSRVDIDGLREHLVDMNALALGADVVTEATADGLRMTIVTAGPPGAAAERMVPAHAPVLEAEMGWSSKVDAEGHAIVWTVRSSEPDAVLRIKALGFFGLMATGDHHPEHHLAIAKGFPEH